MSTRGARPPLVSVVIPTHDRAALLERAVRSVLAQTMPDLEVIVVDDASADDTPAVLARLAAEDERVRAERVLDAGSAARARNHGIARAQGEWVAFLDDDDEWLPRKLERQVEVTRARGAGVGLVYSPYVYLLPDGGERVLGMVSPAEEARAAQRLLRGNFIGNSTVLVRRSVIEAVGGYDPSLPPIEDWDLWIRISRRAGVAGTPEPLVRVHATEGSLSTRRDLLRRAGATLIARVDAEPGVGRRERGNLRNAVGHELMRQGASRDGRKRLLEGIVLWPWPPARWLLLGAALLGGRPYLAARRAHVAAVQGLWALRRRAHAAGD